MNTYLCDSNIFIDYLRGFRKSLQLLQDRSRIKVSAVTVGELLQGARDKKALSNINQMLKNFEVIHTNELISKKALDILEEHHLASGILLFDAFIAATAIEYNLILITGNLKHFKMIKGLKVEKW
ncbi:hypothetical protein A2767_03045 [Candidatus Roizmanbacteria bacterium RIFCSPHIGHO2_01_FULL_35_10]|uniref:Ribonuclease VapC n=1 Tax=Candidatus Roizmanbacteria bacterium RIFCSPLOWO2_01_FULL_35_13 TaxID=1802055 RepID=A0A1F7I8M5_9BACT|nr:MAG: hypothetical protein A2767_03045 [Candidatus Roizmanbacteria bacterium RIFCSPHIGHO2_01_FULL_35_10]OGK39721.1 MAG: hypothetical protein A3A74_04465 [Candidatus Roizmanbacteria bacterium RIFCSPLOWO2_01_FULL_35_13]